MITFVILSQNLYMKRTSIILILFFSFSGFCQNFKDSIILLNGIAHTCNILEKKNSYINVEIKNKKGEVEVFSYEEYRVFSYTQKGKENVVYNYDPDFGNFLTVDESRRYTLGSYDARKTYKPRVVFWSSFAMGYGFSLYDTYMSKAAVINSENPDLKAGFFGKGPTLLPIAVPLVLTATWAFPNIKVREKYILQKNLQYDKMYYHGFNQISKQKRTFAALKGSAMGIALGYISYMAFKIN